MLKRYFNGRHRSFLFFPAATLFTVLILAGAFFRSDLREKKLTLPEYAGRVLATCRSATSRQRCYDEEIPKLMNAISLEEAFEVVKLVQNNDDSFWFCHATAHNISAREYHKDPTQWQEVITRCPIGICSNGCLHGALQEHFSKVSINDDELASLIPDLQNVCAKRAGWDPTPQQHSSCLHEIGHLSLFLTAADVRKAAETCDKVVSASDRQSNLDTCYEGIFMQVFEPREPDDFGLIYQMVPAKEKLGVCEQYTRGTDKGACWKIGWKGREKKFCDQFSQDVRRACFREAWIINDEELEQAKGLIAYCSYDQDPAEQKRCYTKLYYALMSKFEFDEKKMKGICSGLPAKMQGQCFANTATRMIETDKRLVDRAIGICVYAASFGVSDLCYEGLAQHASFFFHRTSGEFLRACSLLPDPWKNNCLNQQ
ncbi:MAG: hypothetical protein HY006_02410 [Candidatus Sungbacteria bacterium]|nr:hypothetical protein [Candidatus Sungbacteria bacterium]